jgi:uncharacterized membrane protein YdbT with pleckstrin-like domain
LVKATGVKPTGVIVVARTWRSEIITLCIAFALSLLSIFLSNTFPSTVMKGVLLPMGNHSLVLHLPLFWFMPAITFFSAMYNIYNVRYTISSKGVEAEIGILALQRRVTRLWFEDIRSFQTNQNLLERLLGVGNLEIGTAATGTVEVTLRGIAAPDEVQEMLQRERNIRQKKQHFLENQQNNREGRSSASA